MKSKNIPIDTDEEFEFPNQSNSDPELAELNFSNLYMRVDQKKPSRYMIGPNEEGRSGISRVPSIYDEQLDVIRRDIDKSTGNSGTIEYGEMRLRFCKTEIVGGEVWAGIRRITLSLPSLDGLNMDPRAVKTIRQWGNRLRGLVIIGGPTGQGKTTTAVASFYDILASKNAIGIAIEDPPEYSLQGPIGDHGLCFQKEVRTDEDWGNAVRDALRFKPRCIFIGEIRTAAAAHQALIASQSGHLVITTAHGGGIDETLGTLRGLAEIIIGSHSAQTLLARNTVGVLYQKLGKNGPDVEILDVIGQTKETQFQIRNSILSGRFEQILNHKIRYDAMLR